MISKQTQSRMLGLAALLLCFFVFTIRVRAQDTGPKAKAIITAMENSADEWNKGNLAAFEDLYDPSATMMSICLFPDTKRQY
jgi:hypothetical protein